MAKFTGYSSLLLFALVIAAPAQAQPNNRNRNQQTPTGQAKPQQPPAGPTYIVDLEDSRVFTFVTRSNRMGHDHGIEGKLSYGKLVLGSGGKLIFDIKSFSADTPRARKYFGLDPEFADAGSVTKKMKSMAVLDVDKFPQATFDINSLKPADNQLVGAAGRYLLDGQFTLHGRKRSLQLVAELKGTNTPGVARMSGKFNILQTDYGIKPFSVMVGAIGIENELAIYGDLVLRLDQGQ